ncbi:MAG TPA: LytTR family DNA-binding domain-containing protein [Candidatus Cybelea sp.]|nr:LytTR family DNA-binding domain-containing protein [Candidatus Cybelea sp.]
MRVLIVDDEPLARTALEKILSGRDDVVNCDSARDSVEALARLRENSYDVLLLDICLPEFSGIELLDSLTKQEKYVPSVIFVTAHDEYAVTAFEKHAVDYVLKPFSEQRINAALDTAVRRIRGDRAVRFLDLLPQIEGLLAKRSKIAIKAKGRILFVDPVEVVTVEAQGNYVLLRRTSGSDLLRESMSTVADRLGQYGFIRIHRSLLVNAAYVEEIQPLATGEYVLRIKGGEEFTVSRTYKKNLRSITRLWFGTDGFQTP